MLDRDTLLGRYLGDRRFILTLPRAVGLQILHPSIGAAIAAHARTGLWLHKQQTVSRMIHLAYASPDPHPAIRYGHDLVHGVDSRGKRYHGLNPELFFFQHATYVETLVTSIETFSRPLSDREKQTLYAQTCEWYLRYGISARHMPATWPEFLAYLDRVCATELQRTPDSDRLAPAVLRPRVWIPRTVPDFALRTLHHPRTRELLAIDQHPTDPRATALYARLIRARMRRKSPRARHIPAARPTLY
ncbi:oxygenase MpaB family protein [Nocardia takedensis]